MPKVDKLLDRALFYVRHLRGSEPRCLVNLVLIELDVPVARVGYGYLQKSIVMLAKEFSQLLTKELYPAVGKSYNPVASSKQIEKDVRTAIGEGWTDCDEETWSTYFPPNKNGDIPKPQSKKFIAKLARFLELWEDLCKVAEKDEEVVEDTETLNFLSTWTG